MTSAEIRDDLLFSLRHPRVRAGFAALVISVAALVVVSAAYWWPARHAAETLQAKIEERRLEISSADSRAQLAGASRRAAGQVAQIEKKLDASVTQAVLVQNLTALARRHNAKIVSQSYEEGKPKDGYAALVHELTLQGSYAELRGFIGDLQGLPTFTIVQEAILGRTANAAAIRAQLDMVTYRRAEGGQP